MSDRLIARVARSKHPALEQYFVRDVLQAFAGRVNARRERANGDRCVWATIQTIADDCERAESRVREAVRILDAAGLLRDTGDRRGGTGRVKVFEVVPDGLEGHHRAREWRRNRGANPPEELADSKSCNPPEELSRNPPEGLASNPPEELSRNPPEGLLHPRTPYKEEPETEPEREPEREPGDALRSEPTLKRSRTPKPIDPVVSEHVEALLPGVLDLHGRNEGAPPSKPQVAGYRQRIASCLQHHGNTETAVSARAAGMAAALRWWALPHKNDVDSSTPSCWWDNRTVKRLLPVHREQLDDLIDHAKAGLARNDAIGKSMNRQRNSGSTGVYRQPDHYEDVTGMNKHETWHPPVEDILDAIGPDPAKAKKGGG